jgi:[acyl-carrier-protein] S-malonyltransferase
MLAIVFPGQGSQRPGMGQAWTGSPSWSVVERLSDATGRDLASLLLDADAPTLQATRNAQLACFALSLVALDAMTAAGQIPAFAAGHSLGEYTALVAAGVLAPEAGATLVLERSEAMQAAADASPGTMAAILGADPELVARTCDAIDDAWLANDNAPGQVVVAGTTAGIEAVTAALESANAKIMALPVGGAFHSPLMAAAQERLDRAIAAAAFADPRVPVVANVDGREHAAAAEWAPLLSQQLCRPVRWRESLERLAALGTTAFVEIGPGGVLTGMVKRTVKGAGRHSVSTPGDLEAVVASLGTHDPG